MEVVDSGVSVHMVCPGPVQTPYFKRQFGDALDKVMECSLLSGPSMLNVVSTLYRAMLIIINYGFTYVSLTTFKKMLAKNL